MSDLQALQQTIGINFNNISLLEQAFVHASYISENLEHQLSDNERLEFLGDAVLSFITAEKIFADNPGLSEGKLTEMRIKMVREETLAWLASELRLGDYLLLGKGEEATGGKKRQTNLADAYEALLGAIFLDQGLDRAKRFILAQFDNLEIADNLSSGSRNYKALLQEYIQADRRPLPEYHLIDVTGPDHDRIFTIEVLLENCRLGMGSGRTKKAAEMAAACEGCQKLIPGFQ